MTMKRIDMEEVKKIALAYKLQPCKIKGTEVIAIRKKSNRNNTCDDIEWPEFERILRKRGVSVYKATESDFLKIMKR